MQHRFLDCFPTPIRNNSALTDWSFTNEYTVNNAGVGFLSTLTSELDPVETAKVYQVNANGPLYMVSSVVPHMPPGGRIINVSSTQSKQGSEMVSTYAASKAALDNLTVSWAGEVRRALLFV